LYHAVLCLDIAVCIETLRLPAASAYWRSLLLAKQQMDFSEAYRISSIPPAFSPDGKYIATAVEYRLVIREVESLRVVQLYSCLDKIHHMEWSCTSTYVLCLLKDRGIVQVWSVDDPDWTCKIDDGPAGIQHASWSSDGQSIIVIADFQIRMTVWSLVDRSCKYLKGPKHAAKGMAFSPDGEYLAVLEVSMEGSPRCAHTTQAVHREFQDWIHTAWRTTPLYWMTCVRAIVMPGAACCERMLSLLPFTAAQGVQGPRQPVPVLQLAAAQAVPGGHSRCSRPAVEP
jgi:WD40 repeat protein